MAMKRITEAELVLPALFLMTQNGNQITTSKLITSLEELMKPDGVDAEILTGRKDSYFSQKVRNLKSHDTLLKKGLAQHIDGGFCITAEGIMYVKENIDNITYLLNNDFSYQDVKNGFGNIVSKKNKKVIALQELISEGVRGDRNVQVVKRSQKLRNVALEHFTHNGVIKCDCCGFEFSSFYGANYGKNCIEIHHIKPIFLYEEGNLVQTIDQALQNLLPVCPNCHRVIHKNHITYDQLPDFKENIVRPYL